MEFYTSEQMQRMANLKKKPQFGWRPKNLVNAEGWIKDGHGTVEYYSNKDPNFNDTDPWENKFSYLRMWRPE